MPVESSDRSSLDPDVVAAKSFAKVRKGYEVDEVRAFLVGLASQLREAQHQRADLDRRVEELERRATDPRELDEDQVTQLLGEETAHVLDTARKAAAEIRARAASEVATAREEAAQSAKAIREAADQYAAGVRSSADEGIARRRTEADEYAEEVRGAADTETAAQRAEADAYAEQVRGDADAEVAELRAHAEIDAARMRTEAESILAERSAEAESAAQAIRSETEAAATRVREDADRYAEATRGAADAYRSDTQGTADTYKAEAIAEGDRVRADAKAAAEEIRTAAESAAETRRVETEREANQALSAAREKGRAMVEEARGYRERIIADLAARRRSAQDHLDQLAAARDALAVALTDVGAQITTSHRSLHEVAIPVGDTGDLSADRQALAGDDSVPELNEPVPDTEAESPASDDAASDPADDSDGGDADVDADGPDGPDGPASAEADTQAAPLDEATVETTDEATEAEGEADPATGPGQDDVDVDVANVADADADADADAAEDAGDPDRVDALFASLRAENAADGKTTTSPRSDDGGGPDAPVGKTQAEISPTAAVADEVEGVTEPTSEADDAETSAEPDDGDPDVDLLDRRDAATDAVERQLARRLKRVLSDEQNETLDLLRRTKGTPAADDVLPADKDHHERYRAAALDDLTEAERAGASFFGAAPQRTADVYDVAGEFATDIQRQIRNRLERAFADGGDEQELGERIRACYREWKTQRIAETARHYVVVAFSRGVAEAAEEGASFRWLVDDGDTPCPDCDDNALAGGVAKGEPFPTGDLCPPAHPGCRCLAVPAE